jgi:hypothetical protein
MLIRGLLVIVAACAALACNRNNSNEENAPSANPVTNTNALVTTSPGTDISSAVNATIVKRFGDESTTGRKTTKLIDSPTTVRTTPYGDEIVAVMTNGAEVTEVARKGDWYLVLFADPNAAAANQGLAGWIYKDAILGAAANVHGTIPIFSCRSDEFHVLSDDSCRLACAGDRDCSPAGGVCDGRGQVQDRSEQVMEGKYCVAVPR